MKKFKIIFCSLVAALSSAQFNTLFAVETLTAKVPEQKKDAPASSKKKTSKQEDDGAVKSIDEIHKEVKGDAKGGVETLDEGAYKAKKKMQKFFNLRTDQDSQLKESAPDNTQTGTEKSKTDSKTPSQKTTHDSEKK